MLPSSVTVWAAVSALLAVPTLNSETLPVSVTAWPALTVGAVLVKTKMPSDVAGSPSPIGSCRKKPLLFTLVTTPDVVTVWPTYGLVAPLPWICQIAAVGADGGGAGGGGGGGVVPPLHGAGAVSELRGSGVPTAKSAALLLVSVQPPLTRRIAVVEDGAGA